MQRGSDKHGPRQDEELKHELEGMERANRSVRVEEWRDPEPPADDDPVTGPARAQGNAPDTDTDTEGTDESTE